MTIMIMTMMIIMIIGLLHASGQATRPGRVGRRGVGAPTQHHTDNDNNNNDNDDDNDDDNNHIYVNTTTNDNDT